MSSFQIKAEKREKTGSSEARRIKNSGKIPAVIHSKNGNLNISLDKREFEIELNKGDIQTRIAEIEIDGKKIEAIANKIELDPVSDQPIHIDLINLVDSKTVKAWPKVVFSGRDRSPGIKRGGFLNVRTRKIEVICESKDKIPAEIDIDISKMQVGEKIRGLSIKLPEGVKFSDKTNFLIASITGRGKSEEETPAAGAAAAPAAGAAGAKPEEKKEEAKAKK